MEFTLGVENEIVRETTSQILEIIQVNPSKKVWKDPKQKKYANFTFPEW